VGRDSAPRFSLPVEIVQMPRPSPRRNRALSVVAAAVLIGAIGLAGVVDITAPHGGRPQSAAEGGRVTAPTPVVNPRPPDVEPAPRDKRVARTNQSNGDTMLAVARRQRQARRDDVAAPTDAQPRTMGLLSFASNGSALFIRDGQTARESDSGDASRSDLGVMTIVDDGARNYHVQPSPDGSQVAFDSDRDGERGVYVARRDGMNVRRISGAGFAALPAWAPDGRRIAYIRAEADNPSVWNLWVQSLGDDRAARMTSYRSGQTWTGSWFADNRHICYSHDDALVVLDVIEGTIRTFPSPLPRIRVAAPAVSPDGTRVIFHVAGHGLWILDLDDGAMRSILDDPSAAEFAWSPDGRRVAFHSRRDDRWGILVISPG